MKVRFVLRKIFYNSIVAAFPWVTIFYLNTIPVYVSQWSRQQLVNAEIHYLYHLLYLAFFILFIYALLYANETASFFGMGVGLASVILFQIRQLCTALSIALYNAIWSIFPYNYLLFNLVGILYLIGIVVKLWSNLQQTPQSVVALGPPAMAAAQTAAPAAQEAPPLAEPME